jgi:chitin deacetylase
MIKRLQFIWPQTTAIVVGVVIGTAVISGLSPLSSLFNQIISRSTNQQGQGTSVDPQTNSQTPAWLTKPELAQTLDRWQQEAQSQMLNWPIPKQFQGKVFQEVKLNAKQKVIALTFDDGPELHSTDQILKILKQNKAKATFFVIGRNLKAYPQLGQRIVAEGHAIANHTWSHRYHKFSPAAAAREIEDTTAAIYKVTGIKTDLFRPPGGFLNNGPAGYAKSKKYAVVMWSADSNDWKRPAAATLANNVLSEARNGGIALMHDGGGDRSHTIKALPYIIARLKKQGYQFVTVPELLDLAARQQRSSSKVSPPAAKPKPNSAPMVKQQPVSQPPQKK